MELRELRLILRRHFLVAALAFLICVTLGAVAAFVPDSSYRTSATILLDLPLSEDGSVSIQQVTFLLPALQEQAQSRTLRQRAADRVPAEFRAPVARIEAVSDWSVLRIRATAKSALGAQAWANAIAEQLIADRESQPGVVSLSLLDPAPVKREAIAPRVEPIMLAAVVLGAIAALFAALAAERVKQAFDTNRAVRSRIGTTVLGEVPTMRRSEAKSPIAQLLDGPNASTDLVYAFETIRTNVEFAMGPSGARRVAIVSLRRQTGKTTIAAGLSCVMARVGRQVVAVEADLHHPTLASQLGCRPGFGLGDISAAGFTGEVPLQSTRHGDLRLLPAGIPVGRAADAIATTLPPVLDQLEREGWQMVVDCPPLRGAPESAIIVAEVRHVILVVNSGGSDVAALTDAVERIAEAGGVLVGIVVNRAHRWRVRREAYPTSRKGRRGEDRQYRTVGTADSIAVGSA